MQGHHRHHASSQPGCSCRAENHHLMSSQAVAAGRAEAENHHPMSSQAMCCWVGRAIEVGYWGPGPGWMKDTLAGRQLFCSGFVDNEE